MVSGRARALHAATGRKVQVLDRFGQRRWNDLWKGNPHIARIGERGNFESLLDGPGCRPYHLEKRTERWVFNPRFRAEAGELYLTDEEREFAAFYLPQVVVEPNLKKTASPNKDWGWARWQEFARRAGARGLHLVQLGPAGTRLLEGVALIETPSFRHACAVLANAQAYVGHEGGLHHAAAALGVPGVVIFGGFTPVELTGYALHRNLGVELAGACGMRVPCSHCEAEMAKIAPERVLAELEDVLEKRRRSLAA